jgi:stage II sporulation protein D
MPATVNCRDMRGVLTLLLFAVLATAATAEAAAVKSVFVVKGRGYGHGVGMSQWGAYGLAQRGNGYAGILAHYYSGTALGRLDGDPEVRVLLRGGGSSQSFTGAAHAGDRELDPGLTYEVTRDLGGKLLLRSAAGRKLETFEGALRVHGTRPVVLKGTAGNGVYNGAYRGALEFRPNALRGVDAINAVRLEDYVRGVVSRESPASWPAEALKAQAVAARTYAITTGGGAGRGFDHYPDQRSQVYGGVTAETPTTDAAVAATRGQVVTYGGRPVVTYFFSTSGGRTENVENSFLGHEPRPWLRSVRDPHDDASPKHTWGPLRLTGGRAARILSGLVPGSFRGIRVVRRGASPRVVQARIIGTRGSTVVSGPVLRKRLGLNDSWAYFRFISSSIQRARKPASKAAPRSDAPSAAPAPTGGVASPPLARMAGPRAPGGPVLAGQIVPARRGAAVRVQLRGARGWRTVIRTSIRGSGGRYRATLPGPGVYRVSYGGVGGPEVRVRESRRAAVRRSERGCRAAPSDRGAGCRRCAAGCIRVKAAPVSGGAGSCRGGRRRCLRASRSRARRRSCPVHAGRRTLHRARGTCPGSKSGRRA